MGPVTTYPSSGRMLPLATAVAVGDCHLVRVERVVFARKPAPLISAVFYQLRVIVRTCGVGNFQNLHGQAVGASARARAIASENASNG